MERRKSKGKTIRRLASVKTKKKGTVHDVDLPAPTYQLEDALLSQVQINDVLNNCVIGENPSLWSIGEDINGSGTNLKKKNSLVYHRCYHDTTLVPIWHAFNILDPKSAGHALLGRIMNLTSTLSKILGDERADIAVQKHFINSSQVPFSQYKRYLSDILSQRSIDAEELSVTCWSYCKQHYMSNPLLQGFESVVPSELCESLYYLFCIFNKLSEPGTYPPTMDYEEVELFLRKLFACLGIPWTPSYEEAPLSDDLDKDDEYEPTSPLQVNFQQLLSVIADLVGVETARTPYFYRSVQRLCLIEYQEVAKADWLTVRKEEHDSWKKRWAVLQRSHLLFYDTILCQVIKEDVELHSNMHVEMLPGISSHKYRFRIVEKEGFSITREFEFSATSSTCAHSWIALLNISIKILETGMTSKTAEICERRLERFKRRESMHEVHKKKQDLHDTYQRLEEAKKNRSDILTRLSERSQQRQAQMEFLDKINKIYERLEAIEFQKSLIKKEEREKRMTKLLNHYEESVKNGKIFDDSCWKRGEDSKVLLEIEAEKSQLESELKDLLQNSSNASNPDLPSLKKRSASVEHISYSSSENLSTSSNDVTRTAALSDVTSLSSIMQRNVLKMTI